MNEEVDFILDSAKENMDRAMAHLEKSFAKIRAGKASPIMLSTVKVDYYGSPTPLSQVANVNTTDARTISVQPWEKNMVPVVERAIMEANLGFNPVTAGDLIWPQASYNGDDAIGLAKSINGTMTLIDAVGTDGADPGSGWSVAGVNNATKNHTLVRKSS